MKKRFVDFEVKEAGDGAFWFSASTEDRDRDGDVLVARGWRLQHYRKNPVILWAHQYDQPPIGTAVESGVEDDRLRLKVKFIEPEVYPFAETIRKMVEKRYLRTGSVGFLPYKREPLNDDDKKQRPELSYGYRLHAELMEFSIVPVPANPMALQGRAWKEFGDVLVKGVAAGPEREDELNEHLKADNPKLLRASVALLLGARGGIKLEDGERKRQFHLLRAKAVEVGAGLDDVLAAIEAGRESLDEATLKGIFKDVWHEELLTLRQGVQAEEDETGTSAEADEQRKKLSVLAESGLKTMEQTAATLSSLSDALR